MGSSLLAKRLPRFFMASMTALSPMMLGGGSAVEDAADQLKKFAAKIDTQSAGSPAALCVLSASGYAYTRPDGVAVVPLGVLGP
ncbi:hypothetical protein FACS1894154_03550 [Betaproteobacteria bacterium]|nr:hypothetical protein FACS1894154_03550 [Betaproteobacteria bacterium]